MKEVEYISSKEAKEMAEEIGVNVSLPTVIQWCRKYHLGHQLGSRGRWAIDKKAFQEFLRGEN